MDQPSTSPTGNPATSDSSPYALTFAEKRKLRLDLFRLSANKRKHIYNIIKINEPHNDKMKLKNFDFYLHLLKVSTLREIQQKIAEYLAKPDVEDDDSSDGWEAFQRI